MLTRKIAGTLALMLGAAVAAPLTPAPSQAAEPPPFDLQAHRGGLGLTVESTLASFDKAIRLGVSTLELDVQITQDGQAVVTHDRKVNGGKCQDTAPATPGDPEYPYVGDYVNTLSFAQVRTLDCGSRTLPQFPGQEASPGARMPLLGEVFDLVQAYDAKHLMLNVETKVEAGAPSETAPREQFVQVTDREIREAGIAEQVTIQSFDWGSLMRMKEVNPRLPLVALTNYDFLQTGQPGRSPWLGGLDIDDFGGDPIKAVDSFGVSAFSPVHGLPQNGKVTDADYKPYVTEAMVDAAHQHGIEVIPWTVDDKATMNKLIDDGVDGLITDYSDRLQEGAVTAAISGNRDRVGMLAQPVRYAGYDGRLSDLDSQAPASFMPLVSDNWTKNFTWNGTGPMPAAEEQKLRDIVAKAHDHGYRLRFWATPDTAGAARDAVWRKLVEVGVDHVNTDDLDGLQRFLTR